MEYLHNNQERIKKISDFMYELLHDSSTEKHILYEKYKTYIQAVVPMDIFYLDMYKQHTKKSISDIKESADRFVNIFHKSLSEHEIIDYDHDFFRLLYIESQMIETFFKSLKSLIKKNMTFEERTVFIEKLRNCEEIEKKFVKIENILFPHIEDKLPSNMPIKVLWELHDDAKRIRKELIDLLKKPHFDQNQFFMKIGEYFFLIYGVNHKEQLILFPVAVKLLSNQELDFMYNEMLEYGFAFMENSYKPKETERFDMSNIRNQVFNSVTGKLDIKTLELMMNILPIDITFVDEFNKVKYFNNTDDRIFPRSPSIIGRDVKNCHPQKSVAIVEKIIDSFREGKRDKAEFWLNFNNQMIYITYVALRDSSNKYVGVLEVSQNITHIKSLNGERRLLDWN